MKLAGLKEHLRKLLPKKVRLLLQLIKWTRPIAPRQCPICGYNGIFCCFGRPPRIDAQCPACLSLERHRLFWLWYRSNQEKICPPVLHFAPEIILEKAFRKRFGNSLHKYITADLIAPADIKLDIECIDLPDRAYQTIICNHVLEHVDDNKALSELRRVIRNDGMLVLSVPIIEGWDHSYENSDILDPVNRELHFGQTDHLRYYGRDLRDRLCRHGFDYFEVTAEGPSVIEHGLWRGEKFFVCWPKSRADCEPELVNDSGYP